MWEARERATRKIEASERQQMATCKGFEVILKIYSRNHFKAFLYVIDVTTIINLSEKPPMFSDKTILKILSLKQNK